MLNLIVAYSKNRVIGNKNELPWYLPADLKHFKETTLDSSVIMGRKTYDSIVARLGHGLPNRQNIVLTRSPGNNTEDTVFVTSLPEALKVANRDNVFIIGGAQVYAQSLPQVDKVYATEIDVTIDGDTYFPELPATNWKQTSKEEHVADEKNPHNYAYATYERKNG